MIGLTQGRMKNYEVWTCRGDEWSLTARLGPPLHIDRAWVKEELDKKKAHIQ